MDIRWLHVEATGSDSVLPLPITSMVMLRAEEVRGGNDISVELNVYVCSDVLVPFFSYMLQVTPKDANKQTNKTPNNANS